MGYDYPGNIRQLENIIEHAFILCSQGEIGIRHLPAYLAPSSVPVKITSSSIDSIRRSTEEEVIIRALERNGYNRLATAKELGMHKTTLFRKLKKLNIDLPDVDGRTSNRSSRK
jgi:transcriptional regulator of acetoin/glycerol metabolism